MIRKFRWHYLLAALGSAYLATLVVLILLEDRLLFHPDRKTWIEPAADLHVEEVWLQADGNRIHGWWLPRERTRGALLFCQGKSGNLSHRVKTVTAFMNALDVSALIFDYPGFGKSGGSPSEQGCYAAAEAAHAWLRQRVPADQIIVIGQSLGGGVAVELASRHPYRALVLASTFASVPAVGQREFPIFPVQWLARNRFDNLSKIGRCTGPVFIAHGDQDRLIPCRQAERLFARVPGRKRLLVLQGQGHHGPLPAEFFSALAMFLNEAASAR